MADAVLVVMESALVCELVVAGEVVFELIILKQVAETVGIESNHHLFACYQCRRRAALIFINQVLESGSVIAYIAFFKLDTPAREVGLYRVARRSARLGKQN